MGGVGREGRVDGVGGGGGERGGGEGGGGGGRWCGVGCWLCSVIGVLQICVGSVWGG